MELHCEDELNVRRQWWTRDVKFPADGATAMGKNRWTVKLGRWRRYDVRGFGEGILAGGDLVRRLMLSVSWTEGRRRSTGKMERIARKACMLVESSGEGAARGRCGTGRKAGLRRRVAQMSDMVGLEATRFNSVS